MTIIGQVEGHMILPPQNKTTKYEHIMPQLVAIEQNSDIEGLLLLLNTVGGDVEAGLAIAGELSRDIGTSVIGRDAVSYGIINEIGGLSHAQTKLNELIKIQKETKGLKQ